jgi:2-iminobutanoate/2-iminopropanoate deaminase
MKPVPVFTDRVPAGRARISQGMILGDTLYVSGMVGRTPETGTTIVGGMAEQTRQTLENIKSVVEAAGSSMDRVAKTNCYIADIDQFEAFNTVWESYFPTNPPARLCVQVRLGATFLIEIEAIVGMPD